MPSFSKHIASLGRVLFVLAVSAVTFVVGGWLMTRIAVSGPADRVPDLRGLGQSEAVELLEGLGMSLEVDEDRLQVDAIAADHVARQEPAPGTPVKRMRIVRVMLSTGPVELMVPNHVGDARQRALIRLEQQGVPVDYVASAPSYDVPRDTIMAQSPAADAPPAEAGRPLRLLSSLGAPVKYYVMPNLVTQPVGDVRRQIETLGFRVTEGSNRRVHANVPPGTIVAQSPQPGFRIAAGGEIVLQVSR